jgi:hypothetical protein
MASDLCVRPPASGKAAARQAVAYGKQARPIKDACSCTHASFIQLTVATAAD